MAERALLDLSGLIVDENRHMRLLLRSVLGAFGLRRMREARDGAEGLCLLRDAAPDFIITSAVMAGLNGLEFTRYVRASPGRVTPFVPVLMISAHNDRQTLSAARDAGINEFLPKPVTPRAVLDHLTTVIKAARPFVRTDDYFGPCRRRRHGARHDGGERRGPGGAVFYSPRVEGPPSRWVWEHQGRPPLDDSGDPPRRPVNGGDNERNPVR